MPVGDGDHGMHQIDRRSRQSFVKQIRQQADGDAPRLTAEQRPGQQIVANANYPGPDRTRPLHPGESGIAGGGRAAHSGELAGYPHRPTIVTARADGGATRRRIPTCIVPVFPGRPGLPNAGGIGGSRGQAAPDVYATPSAHQPPGTRKSVVCTTGKQ